MLSPQIETSNRQLKDITEKLDNTVDIALLALLFRKNRV